MCIFSKVSRRQKIRGVCELSSPGTRNETANLCEVYVVDKKKKQKKKIVNMIQGKSDL